ncbi:Transmembrane protein 145 [Camponotus japonicus]
MTACRKPTRVLCVWLLCLSLQPNYAHSTHITDTFNTREFFRFLIKFGFQKTDCHRQKDSYGYIFGNVTATTDIDVPITLTILDRDHFLEYYGNRTLMNKSIAC